MIYFKLPGENPILTLSGNSGDPRIVFTAFEGGVTQTFSGEVQEVAEKNLPTITNAWLSTNPEKFFIESEEDYQHKITQVIDFVKENHLPKLVVARRKTAEVHQQKINFTKTFIRLTEQYPEAFCYFYISDGKGMMGAFSELLGKFDKKTSEFLTMSLAGTLPVSEQWTAKEVEEQAPVSEYILSVLKNFSENVESGKPRDHISGNIKHLRTDFKAAVSRENVDALIHELHPTPAVCGIPKDFCMSAIKRFEGFDRKNYAGYIRVETDTFIYFFVNLRCAELFENQIIAFAGGGITALSSPSKEWRETELKADAIIGNLVWE